MRRSFRTVLALLLLAALAPLARAGDPLAEGRALYLEGRRTDGSPLTAERAGGLALSGAQAACVSCHRRSGMGGAEGRTYIPPVTAHALFTAMPRGKGASAIGDGRPAYGEQSLAHALREGLDASGRPLDFLMPRYRLRDEEVRALMAYVGTLPDALPADAAGALHFATVIAPDVPRESSEAMLGVLQACFAEQNAGPQPERGRRKLAGGMSQVEGRRWELHVWNLQGPQETWGDQLAQHASEQPVFALVGGIGRAQWAPVDAFCERSAVPCVFPHLEATGRQAGGFYPLYLGKGALLEAGLVAHQLEQQQRAGRRVVQVLREHDPAAEAAAAELRRLLAEQGAAMRELRLPAQGTPAPDHLASVQPQDTLVLWLRPGDLQQLEALTPNAAQVFVSATLAGRDDVPLPSAWKARSLMAYPYELPQQRGTRVTAMRRWLQEHGLPVTDERVQADAYVACKALGTAVRDARDDLGRDYVVERIETDLERSTATGLYPRLTLGIGQRFASKTGYLVRFEEGSGRLLPVGERVAP